MQNNYDDGKSNFLSPKVTQYDGHMVMTNVTKPTKRKFINIDTRYRDNYSSLTQCEFTLPDKITEVKSMTVRNVEIPVTTYNYSSNIGNNYFQIDNGVKKTMIILPDGEYTPDILADAVNLAINDASLTYFTNKTLNARSKFTNANTVDVSINFAVNANGEEDLYNIKKKLGWALGFRTKSYKIKANKFDSNYVLIPLQSESFVDYTGLRYLYLVVDEYTKGNQNSFMAALPSSLVRKNILARISMNKFTFPFGSFLPANNFNGYLLSDSRTYSGKVDVQKLSIQLVDDAGNPVDLNGLDYSFCLEVEHE